MPSTSPTRPRLLRARRRVSVWLAQTLRRTRRAADFQILGIGLPEVRKHKPGTAPGIEPHELSKLPSTGEPVVITCIDYAPTQVQTQKIDDVEDFILHHRPDWATVRWINVDGLTDMGVIRAIAEKYQLHPLAIEDTLHVPQRPKLDAYSGEGQAARLFVIARMVQLKDGKLENEQVSMFVGHKTLITFQETPGDVWDPIRQRINTRGSRLRVNDASFLVYALLDAIVDHCFPILEEYGDQLHEIEEAVLDNPDERTVVRIHQFNRELMLLRRQMWPMRDVVTQLQRENHECMGDNARTYLRDVSDHLVQIIDLIETYREIAASMGDTYATGMGNRLNEVVKVLTILTAIFTPPTFLASVYGMNFQHLPELEWKYSYYAFWIISIIMGASMILWFRWRKWI
jgi:magnesium transporter